MPKFNGSNMVAPYENLKRPNKGKQGEEIKPAKRTYTKQNEGLGIQINQLFSGSGKKEIVIENFLISDDVDPLLIDEDINKGNKNIKQLEQELAEQKQVFKLEVEKKKDLFEYKVFLLSQEIYYNKHIYDLERTKLFQQNKKQSKIHCLHLNLLVNQIKQQQQFFEYKQKKFTNFMELQQKLHEINMTKLISDQIQKSELEALKKKEEHL